MDTTQLQEDGGNVGQLDDFNETAAAPVETINAEIRRTRGNGFDCPVLQIQTSLTVLFLLVRWFLLLDFLPFSFFSYLSHRVSQQRPSDP